MKKIIIKTASKTYPYYSGRQSFVSLPQLLKKHKLNGGIAAVIDGNVYRLWKKQIDSVLRQCGCTAEPVIISPGERSKSFAGLQFVLKGLLSAGLGRDGVVIAIGGGVTGDLAGFAASVYKRGTRLVHIPTTLLAAVDSCIGGKTGIDFDGIKNSAGTFYQPEFILADPVFLDTLPEEEIQSGLGEIAKYGFLRDEKIFSTINSFLRHPDLSGASALRVISDCVAIKAQTVEQDEREAGIRKILNLGHTFAHAAETVTGYKVKHGVAVAFGLLAAVHLSHLKGFLSAREAGRMLDLVLALPLPAKLKRLDASEMLTAMMHDKKNSGGVIQFVLLKAPGELLINVPAVTEEISRAIKLAQELV